MQLARRLDPSAQNCPRPRALHTKLDNVTATRLCGNPALARGGAHHLGLQQDVSSATSVLTGTRQCDGRPTRSIVVEDLVKFTIILKMKHRFAWGTEWAVILRTDRVLASMLPSLESLPVPCLSCVSLPSVWPRRVERLAATGEPMTG